MTTFDVSKNDPGTLITVTAARSTGVSTISISGWPAGWTSFPMTLTAVRSGSLRAYFRVTGQASGVLSGVTSVEGSDASLAIGDLLYNRPTAGNDLALKDSVNNLESTRVIAGGVSGGQTISGGTGAGEPLTLQSTSHATKGPVQFTGDLIPTVSNTYDVGHSGSQRVRNIYANGNIETNAGQFIGDGSALSGIQLLDSELTAIAGLTSAADKLPYFTGSGTASLATFTSFGRSLIDDADATTARTTLGLIIGTDVQAYDTELAAIAGLTSAADKLPYFTGSGTASLATFTSFGRSLVDDTDASTARTTLGLVIGTDIQAWDTDLDTLAALTKTKGNVIAASGSVWATLAVGTDGQVLTADAASSNGVKWADVGSGSGQPLDDELTAIAGLTSAADKVPYFTGSGTASLATLTTFGRSLIDDTDATAAQTTLGLVIGTDVQAYDADLAALAGLTSAADKVPYFTGSGTASVTTFTSFGRSLVDDIDASTARTTLGLVIGTDVQAYDAELAAIAGLTSAADKLPYFTGSGTAAVTTLTTFGRSLIDDADATAAKTTLGLGTTPFPFSFGGSGVPVIGTDLCPWLRVPYAATCTQLTLTTKTAPSGNFTITIKRSTDSGSTFPDTIGTATVTTGTKIINTTTFTNAALAAGDLLRLDISAVNAAADWTARLLTLIERS
jgi:hypothetical protein